MTGHAFRTLTFRNMRHGVFVDETTPTARALMVLEMVQNSPGISGEQLAGRLGMTDRAVRRYVGNLRDAGIAVESTRGKYGGYRIGRGVRLAPLMFTAPEALGLVMAVLEGRRTDPTDPVGQAVAKLIRVLPKPLAEPVEAVVRTSERTPDGHSSAPDPQVAAAVAQGTAGRKRLRLGYRLRGRPDRGDGRRPVGARGAVRQVVPARLVAHRRCPPRSCASTGSSTSRSSTRSPSSRRTSTPWWRSRSTSPRAGGTGSRSWWRLRSSG